MLLYAGNPPRARREVGAVSTPGGGPSHIARAIYQIHHSAPFRIRLDLFGTGFPSSHLVQAP